jgi:hypothetical protein
MQISSDLGGIPQKAIDGSTSSFFNVDTCTLTRAERVPWWYVNLLEPYMVQLVRLDFGKSNLSGQVAFNSYSDSAVRISIAVLLPQMSNLNKGFKYSMLRSGRL